jgi:ABC-2 type transport system permease protein
MNKVIALALKDLRLMPRNKGGMFFTFIWPILVTVLFGIMFGGTGGGEQGKVRIAIVDEDNTAGSRAFAKALEESFDLTAMSRADAENAVRLGQRAGYIALTPGFGAASNRMFYGEPKQVELGVDPARTAEAGMIEGLLMKQAAADMQKMFNDPDASSRMVDEALSEMKQQPDAATPPVERFLGELKAFVNTPQPQGPGQQGQWQPLTVVPKAVAREQRGPENAFDVTFPQGVIWGLIGCMMTFGISLVTERTHGTLVRLRMAPLTRAQILGGKALSCFVSIMLVEVMLLGVAWIFGVRPSSLPMLARRRPVGGDLLRRLHDAGRRHGQDRADRIRRGLGGADAAVDGRRRDGADLRDAVVDSIDQLHQPDSVGDPGDRRRRVAQFQCGGNGGAMRDPDHDRHRVLRDRHAQSAGRVSRSQESGARNQDLLQFNLAKLFEHRLLRGWSCDACSGLRRLRIRRRADEIGGVTQVVSSPAKLHVRAQHRPVRAGVLERHADAARVDDARASDYAIELHVGVSTHHQLNAE